MNTTQRKYAIKRIFDIFYAQMENIQKEDTAAKKKCGDFTKIKLVDIQKGIANGTIKPRKIATKLVGTNPSVDDLYELQEFKEVLLKKKNIKEIPGDYQYINLKARDLHSSNSLGFDMPSSFKRIAKMQAALNSIVDDIMLGDSQKALDAINAAESRKF